MEKGDGKWRNERRDAEVGGTGGRSRRNGGLKCEGWETEAIRREDRGWRDGMQGERE